MRRHLALAVALSAALVGSLEAQTSWIFRRSSFSHDPATGKRVIQYAPNEARYVRVDLTYQQSVYRHHRSTIRGGDSADRMHMVERWGEEPVRPYGEWERPYREGATPYGPWGNPQGPWTTPFGAWTNPYGLLPRMPWGPWPYGTYQGLPWQPGTAVPSSSPDGTGEQAAVDDADQAE